MGNVDLWIALKNLKNTKNLLKYITAEFSEGEDMDENINNKTKIKREY